MSTSFDPERSLEAVQEELKRSPYLVLGVAAGIGWLLARPGALPVLGAVAGFGLRAGLGTLANRALTELQRRSTDRNSASASMQS